MLGFDNNSNSNRIETFLYAIPDLGGEPLLYLQPATESFNNPGDLAETGNMAVRNISNMCFAEEREHMMFAH